MIQDLQLFLNALERVKGPHYIQHLKIEPMLKPAFKKLILTVYSIQGDEYYTLSTAEKIYRITDDTEKNKAIADITEELIVNILKNEII